MSDKVRVTNEHGDDEQYIRWYGSKLNLRPGGAEVDVPSGLGLEALAPGRRKKAALKEQRVHEAAER